MDARWGAFQAKVLEMMAPPKVTERTAFADWAKKVMVSLLWLKFQKQCSNMLYPYQEQISELLHPVVQQCFKHHVTSMADKHQQWMCYQLLGESVVRESTSFLPFIIGSFIRLHLLHFSIKSLEWDHQYWIL